MSTIDDIKASLRFDLEQTLADIEAYRENGADEYGAPSDAYLRDLASRVRGVLEIL